MNRSQLSEAAGIPFGEGPDFEATGVTEDSRRVRPGFVFAALPGVHADGHDYAARAVEAGAHKITMPISASRKHSLLNGLDEIGLTLQKADMIRQYEAERLARHPWLVGQP